VVTTFIVDPAAGGTSKVTIGIEWQGASGIGSFFERCRGATRVAPVRRLQRPRIAM